jgi:hypothetical protein
MNNRRKNTKLLLLIPALWASLLDIGLTIYGQSSDYWKGNLKVANEGNPIGVTFMKNHVSGIFLVCGIWIILIVVLGYYLPRKISRGFLLFVLIANSWGASSWIQEKYGFWGAIGLFVFSAVLYVIIDEICLKDRIDKIKNL